MGAALTCRPEDLKIQFAETFRLQGAKSEMSADKRLSVERFGISQTQKKALMPAGPYSAVALETSTQGHCSGGSFCQFALR